MGRGAGGASLQSGEGAAGGGQQIWVPVDGAVNYERAALCRYTV